MSNKRISFNKDDAIHSYEHLLFYWEDYFIKHPENRKEMGKFGGCFQCTKIGERLEKFIGKEEIKQVEKYLRKENR